jgi:hypothetical protein
MRSSGSSSALRLPGIAPPSSTLGLSHGGGEGRRHCEEIAADAAARRRASANVSKLTKSPDWM